MFRMRGRSATTLAVAAALALAGCGGEEPEDGSVAPPERLASSAEAPPSEALIQAARDAIEQGYEPPKPDEPCEQYVQHPDRGNFISEEEPGKPFYACPSFHNYADQSIRPAFAPPYPTPLMVPGTAVTGVNGQDGYPVEYQVGPDGRAISPGDPVLVVCQAEGQPDNPPETDSELTDGNGRFSNIWDVVPLPEEKVTKPEGLPRVETERGVYYLAFISDLWLGDTSRDPSGKPSLGVHEIPCP